VLIKVLADIAQLITWRHCHGCRVTKHEESRSDAGRQRDSSFIELFSARLVMGVAGRQRLADEVRAEPAVLAAATTSGWSGAQAPAQQL